MNGIENVRRANRGAAIIHIKNIEMTKTSELLKELKGRWLICTMSYCTADNEEVCRGWMRYYGPKEQIRYNEKRWRPATKQETENIMWNNGVYYLRHDYIPQ